MTGLYIPETLSRKEVVDVMQGIPVDNQGTPGTFFDVAEEVRTGRLVLSVHPRGATRSAEVPHVDLLGNSGIPALIHGPDLVSALERTPVIIQGETRNLYQAAEGVRTGALVLHAVTAGHEVAPGETITPGVPVTPGAPVVTVEHDSEDPSYTSITVRFGS